LRVVHRLTHGHPAGAYTGKPAVASLREVVVAASVGLEARLLRIQEVPDQPSLVLLQLFQRARRRVAHGDGIGSRGPGESRAEDDNEDEGDGAHGRARAHKGQPPTPGPVSLQSASDVIVIGVMMAPAGTTELASVSACELL